MASVSGPDQFAAAVLQNPNLSNEVHNVKKRAFFLVAQGIATILIGIVMSVQVYLAKKRTLTNEELSKRITKSIFYTRLNMIVSGGLLIFNAYSLIFMYKPSNTETSLAVLIKYLRKNGVISENIYTALKKFKPHRVQSLKIPP